MTCYRQIQFRINSEHQVRQLFDDSDRFEPELEKFFLLFFYSLIFLFFHCFRCSQTKGTRFGIKSQWKNGMGASIIQYRTKKNKTSTFQQKFYNFIFLHIVRSQASKYFSNCTPIQSLYSRFVYNSDVRRKMTNVYFHYFSAVKR